MAPDLLDLFVCARQANGGVSEPAPEREDGDEKAVGGKQRRAPRSDARPAAGFERSQALFGRLVEWAAGEQALGLEHSELEARLAAGGRELARQVLQDQLDLRAVREQRPDAAVIGSDGIPRRSVERGHERDLHTVLGEVQVTRLAYRALGSENLYPADAQLNLPPVRHSHGIRRLAALEAPRSSFEDAQAAIVRATGQQIGTRQLRELTLAAAQDVGAFYAQRTRTAPDAEDLLVLSCDAKGVVMRPEALREQTRTQAQNASGKLKTRLSKGEKSNRKRMAEIVTVYELTPEPRTAADILPDPENPPVARTRPKAKNKWLKASVSDDASAVIAEMFNEADRRDRDRQLAWVALVDGNNHQIDRIKTEARKRKVKIPIVIDFIHVLEYLWSACWCFFQEGDPAAEQWVHEKALAVLEGKAGIVAAAIRRKATRLALEPNKRQGADRCADYLLAKRPYLDYPTALANGWPIATGVIEGACRHLVKDRMDITGARWGLAGAEAILTLRALISNGEFDEYWTFHLAQEHRRVHASRYALGVIPTPA